MASTLLHFTALAMMLLSGRWIRELGGSESTLGWFSASIVPGIALGALMAGRLASRVAEKRLIVIGALLVAGTSFSFARFDEITLWLAPLRFLQGVGHGMVFTCLISLVAHAVSDGQKARGIGYVTLFAQLGNVGGVALAEGVLLPFGFSAVFAGAACIAGLTGLAALTLPGSLSHSTRHPGTGGTFSPSRHQVVLTVFFFMMLGGSYGTVLQLIPLLVQDLPGVTEKTASATPVMAAIFMTVAICRLFLARLADGRLRQPVLIGSTLLLIAASASWPFVHAISAMVAVAIAFAFGYGLLFPGLNGLVLTKVAGDWRSRASGWIVMAFDGGFFGLLLGLGPIADHFGYITMFSILCTLQLLSALLFLAMARRIAPVS
ncbi:MAG: MFS transporter [Betaproteobacteria bacterium]